MIPDNRNKKMPDPKLLKVGDRIKYVTRPLEWIDPKFKVCEDDKKFLDAIIKRGYWQRIYEIDEYGNPWIEIRLKVDGKVQLHTWAIFEDSGWILKSVQ